VVVSKKKKEKLVQQNPTMGRTKRGEWGGWQMDQTSKSEEEKGRGLFLTSRVWC